MNPKLAKWEEPLFELLRSVDNQLESEFGDLYPHHPARPPHGATTNPQNDGLLRVSANFTAGFGSDHGRGYTLNMEFVTLVPVADKHTDAMESRALKLIQDGLDRTMPERHLKIKRDGNLWKIVGNLSLS
ncbi:MAG: hypothetical protein PHO37_10710 [Kiritimatiellae bacterium]|nr:hypothetical protein [Kiritimatiellia bacterium]